MIFIQIILPFLFIYYVYIVLRLSTGNIKSKREFMWNLIPFYRVYHNITQEWKKLN